MDGAGVPQFHGTDAKECEEFIAGVIKHAYNQGKLRDDEWIADFALTCLAHDALRWWIGLDEETQKSWRLLRQAMVSKYQPLFHGRNGKEAEQFVHSVRQRARDVGKQDDNDWIITFVSDCFVGNALRWYEALDSSIQNDWKSLRAAILAQYPCDSQSAQRSNIPTPALAASPPPRSKTRGCIRVLKKNNSNFEYLSKRSFGLTLSSARTNALEVEYDPTSSTPHTLFIPDGQISGFDTLGAQWNPTNVYGVFIL